LITPLRARGAPSPSCDPDRLAIVGGETAADVRRARRPAGATGVRAARRRSRADDKVSIMCVTQPEYLETFFAAGEARAVR